MLSDRAKEMATKAAKSTKTEKAKELSAEEQLSDKAKIYLKNLRRSRNFVDFRIAEKGKENDALAGKSNKEFTVVLSNEEIERYNIYNAARIAMQRAVEQLKVRPDFLLIDAMPFENYPIPNFSMVKGDEKSVSIAAASVIAKVYRDRLMKEYAKKYPHYDFENNAGYGTKKHLEGLKEHGITPIHRRDFEPIKSMVQGGKHEQ